MRINGLINELIHAWAGFLCGSAGKESACKCGRSGFLSLSWEDPLEKGKATHSNILAWKNSMHCIVHGVTKSQTQLNNFHFHMSVQINLICIK